MSHTFIKYVQYCRVPIEWEENNKDWTQNNLKKMQYIDRIARKGTVETERKRNTERWGLNITCMEKILER